MSMRAKLIERDGDQIVVDEYGDEWDVFTDDGRLSAIQRPVDDGGGWETGQFDAVTGDLYPGEEGQTFGVSCQDEYIATRSHGWIENEPADSGPWCVCGQESDGPWETFVAGLADRDAAEAWLRENHREHPEVTAWYIDRESNEGHADTYYDRCDDGNLVESTHRTAFAD